MSLTGPTPGVYLHNAGVYGDWQTVTALLSHRTNPYPAVPVPTHGYIDFLFYFYPLLYHVFNYISNLNVLLVKLILLIVLVTLSLFSLFFIVFYWYVFC